MTAPSDMQPLVRENIRLAATVMLVRDSGTGLEVYMVKRPGRGDFPDLHVFPGGKVDEEDFNPALCYELADQVASERLGIAAGGVRYWVAVARECFEECGVLMVRRNGSMLDFRDDRVFSRFESLREDVLAGNLGFVQMCEQENLQIACDMLGYFSHWITPEMAPRRFDTRFFLAAMPGDQATLAHTDETADDDWVSPREALDLYRKNRWQMIDPTLRSLETLSQYDSVGEALVGVQGGNHLMPLTPELNRQGMQPLR